MVGVKHRASYLQVSKALLLGHAKSGSDRIGGSANEAVPENEEGDSLMEDMNELEKGGDEDKDESGREVVRMGGCRDEPWVDGVVVFIVWCPSEADTGRAAVDAALVKQRHPETE